MNMIEYVYLIWIWMEYLYEYLYDYDGIYMELLMGCFMGY